MTSRTRRRHWAQLPRLGRVGVLLLLSLLAVAVAAPWLAPYVPTAQIGPAFAPPSSAHWLGTNDIGQDILSELIFGARISLTVGLAAATAATVVGSLVGLVGGYLGGWADAALMRIVDIVLSLPFLPLMIVLGVFLGPGLTTIVVVIAVVAWAPTARELRSQVLVSRQRDSVRAVEALGAGPAHVLRHHLLPMLVPLIVPQFIQAARVAILAEASLSFLGLGDATAKSWGNMLFFANARSAFLTDAWRWWIIPPGGAIALSVLSFVFIGFALEERARPRLHALLPAWRRPAGPASHRPAGRASDQPAREGPLLAVADLAVAYDHQQAVDRPRFEVQRGEVLGIVGRSGSGKSTVLGAVMGILKAPARITAGSVRYDGEELLDASPRRLQQLRGKEIALVPQAAMNALDPVRPVRWQIVEAIRQHRRISRRRAEARAAELLELVGLPPERSHDHPHEFSGGMRQRVTIAMALANDPRLLLVDEPTTGLDPDTRDGLVALLAALRKRLDLTVVFVSHDLDVVRQVADRLAVMSHGRLVEQGHTADVVAHPRHPYTRRLLAASLPSRPRRPTVTETRPELLHLEGVTKHYAGTVAVNGVDLSLHDGEVVGLVGPSGAGKTTLGRLILRLERVDAGRIRFLGEDHAARTPRGLRTTRRHLQMVFQDPYQSLPDHRCVQAIVSEALRIHDEDDVDARAGEALKAVGLPPATYRRRYPSQLSGGERQRVALARAVVLRPRLIVLDEPTSMLDAELRTEIIACLENLRDMFGVAYLCITHDLVFARAFCDRFVELRDAAVMRSGPIDGLDADTAPNQGGALLVAKRSLT